MGVESLEVRQLDLVGPDGAVRASLRIDEVGDPVFELLDSDGNPRLQMAQAADSDRIYILDAEGTTRIGIAQFAHGGGGFALHGPESKGAAVLYLKDKGSLRIFDKSGDVTSEFPN